MNKVNTSVRVVIVGGGSGGVSVAARLMRTGGFDVTIIDPAKNHYYQPLFTLVGAGACDLAETFKPLADVVPYGVELISEPVLEFNPEANTVATASGKVSYDFLVVAPGIQIDWHKVPGLVEGLGRNGICSNYSENTVEGTFRAMQNFRGGNAVFTYPNTPIKCGGAPQKIMYLAEHYFRKHGTRSDARVLFASAGGGIFGVKKYADALNKVVENRGIDTAYQHNLIEVKPDKKIAVFSTPEGNKEVEFEMLHVAPPMSAPDFIKQSPLAGESLWVDVHKHNLQHNKYKNIFSLGDASSLPTSKTGAAIRKQAPVLVENLICAMEQKELTGHYDGYTSCPLVTGYGSLILAEFDYDGNPAETFPFDQSKERLSMYLMKKYILPILYWQGMLKGVA